MKSWGRICANFKMTINPYLCSKTFPLPTVDEMFSTLAEGESSKIDLGLCIQTDGSA